MTSRPRLPGAFLDRPIAHRALHGQDRPENSPEAITAAVQAGYGIEIDLQMSADNQAMVFHDYALDRLTGEVGPVRQRSVAELQAITLTGGAAGIPTFAEVLQLVKGKVPLLIELKDQDGALGPDVGPLEEAAAAALETYDGPAAVMSFNPHSIALLAELCPDRPRGLVTCHFPAEDWPTVPEAVRAELRPIADLERIGGAFISHQASDLAAAPVAAVKASGLPVLCWTIRSPEQEAQARQIADNVTFEGYLA